MVDMGIPAIRIMAVSYFLCVIGMISSTVFQALGKGNDSMYLTFVRQVALPLIFVSVLTAAGSLTHVWYAFILAEVLSAPLCAFLMHRIQKDILQNLT